MGGENSDHVKKNLAKISFALCVLTRPNLKDQRRGKSETNYSECEMFLEECLDQFKELYGDNNDEYEYIHRLLVEEPDQYH